MVLYPEDKVKIWEALDKMGIYFDFEDVVVDEQKRTVTVKFNALYL